eukprot:maker-scaffold_39-snap-gene-0.38-mRNA-1 protein AED:0.02 eAED:0.02 QI:113/1/1/1/1/1/2/104/164
MSRKSSREKLPPGWVMVTTEEKPQKIYYFNELSRVSTWDRPKLEKSPKEIKANHILVKHAGVKNPYSKRTQQKITYTKAEALEKLKTIQSALEKVDSSELKPEFEKVAQKESDCSSFKRGGDLGPFDKRRMQKPFSKAAFALRVDEMSGIIESPSGFHLIYRTK